MLSKPFHTGAVLVLIFLLGFPDRATSGKVFIFGEPTMTIRNPFRSKERDWKKVRRTAHWILSYVFQFTQNHDRGYFIMTKDGHAVGINKKSTKTVYVADTQFVIDTLIKLGRYNSDEIYRAINVLVAYEHIEPVFELPTDTHFKTIKGTPKGRIAFEDFYYLRQIEERNSTWTKRNWIGVAIFTYAIGLATPILIDKLKSIALPETKTVSTKPSLEDKTASKR